MSQFIIATNNATVVQRNAITEYIKLKGWAWWHHFEDLWVVATGKRDVLDYDQTSSEQIFGEITKLPVIGDATYIVVFKLSGEPRYSGFGPKAGWDWAKMYLGDPG